MAYLHCHNCGWSQDDFWSFRFSKYGYWHHWRYNPISLFFSYVENYLWPRRIRFDSDVAKDIGPKRKDPHSWYLIWYEFKRMIKMFFHQKYWTYGSWKRSVEKNKREWPPCPNCKKRMLDID